MSKKYTEVQVEQEILFDYEGIGGNLFVNPDSTIEEQVEELVRQDYELKGLDFDELNPEGFDELKIKIEGQS